MKVFVVSKNIESAQSILVDDHEILMTLGKEEDAVVFQIKELFDSVTDNLIPSLEGDSEITIEVEGSISLKVEGGIKYLFFNVGGSVEEAGKMKISLKTFVKSKLNSKK